MSHLYCELHTWSREGLGGPSVVWGRESPAASPHPLECVWCIPFSAFSPQDEDASFHFDGSGHSVVEKTLRATITQIIMLFNTFSPNGLLLYLASNGTVRVLMG